MEMPKKDLASDKNKYEAMLSALAAEHPELQEEVDSLQESLFDLSQPDVAGEQEEVASEEEPMDEEEDGAIEIELAMPGKRPIPKELMDEEEMPMMKHRSKK